MSGTQESKWPERLRFKLTGRWSDAVVAERLNDLDADLRHDRDRLQQAITAEKLWAEQNKPQLTPEHKGPERT